jgi:hypothetical protein
MTPCYTVCSTHYTPSARCVNRRRGTASRTHRRLGVYKGTAILHSVLCTPPIKSVQCVQSVCIVYRGTHGAEPAAVVTKAAGSLRPNPVIYVTSIERLPICIMKCHKSVRNVGRNGNIEMMYSHGSPARAGPHHIKEPSVMAAAGRGAAFVLIFFFAVDIEINGGSPNGRQY